MLEFWKPALLFGTGLAAGFVDSIAGGGGLITLPVLLSTGLDPHVALGTNKLQATFGSGSASWHYAQAKTVDLRDCVRGFVCSLIGAAAGTLAVQQLDPGFLRRALPVLLIAIAVFVLVKPQLGAHDIHPRIGRHGFDLLFGLGLGFYDGFLGPGTGTFWTMAFMLCLGFNMTRATGYTKVMNLASNVSSLTIFLVAGYVSFVPGLLMGLGQLVGARLGSALVITRGTRLIRPVFIMVVLAITVKLLIDEFRR